MVVLFAVAIWPRHNHKVSTSVLGANCSHALDGSRVGWWWWWVVKDVYVLVVIVIVTESALVLKLVLIVLTPELLSLMEEDSPHRRARAPTTAGGHPGHQELVTKSGVLWSEGSGKRVGNKLVFTFTSSGGGRQGPRDRLLARLGRARSGASVLLLHCWRT